jgi:hypothetical protein
MKKNDNLKLIFLFLGLFIGLVLVLKYANMIDNFNFDRPNDVQIENPSEEVSEK